MAAGRSETRPDRQLAADVLIDGEKHLEEGEGDVSSGGGGFIGPLRSSCRRENISGEVWEREQHGRLNIQRASPTTLQLQNKFTKFKTFVPHST